MRLYVKEKLKWHLFLFCFVCLQRHILDVQYFDPLFTKRHAAITPIDESILATMDQKPFKDFSYTNPNITDWRASCESETARGWAQSLHLYQAAWTERSNVIS